MKIVLPGGNGFIGRYLAQYFTKKGWEVSVLTRKLSKDRINGVKYHLWDGKSCGIWREELEGADIVFNLSGKSVNCRYTEANKREILSSRIESTRILGEAIEQCRKKPTLWINAGTTTIFVDTPEEEEANDEYSNRIGDDFSMTVAKKWEEEFNSCSVKGVRKIILRMAIVFGKEDGVWVRLKNMVTLGLGGKIGNGRQMVSFIHVEDVGRMIECLFENKNAEGIYNAAAPFPLTFSAMMKTIREEKKMPIGIPTPEWLMKIGAKIIGTETELVLKSRKVVSRRLNDLEFKFKYPTMKKVVESLV